MSCSDWVSRCREIGGVLSDIHGVLYESGGAGGKVIPGSIEAVNKLKSSGVPVRFCTNETTVTKDGIAAKLQRLGFDIKEAEIFAPVPAVISLLKQRGLRPHLLVHPDVLPDFAGVDQMDPNCIVLGDATSEFSYSNMNKAFQLLVSLKQPVLISMGKGRFYKHGEELILDVGPFCTALEYACDIKAEIVGKPAASFFQQAVQDMNISADQTLMIGDDIVSDVGGAQDCGLLGIQVRTGKYRASDENHDTVKPDGYVNNFAQFVDMFLEARA